MIIWIGSGNFEKFLASQELGYGQKLAKVIISEACLYLYNGYWYLNICTVGISKHVTTYHSLKTAISITNDSKYTYNVTSMVNISKCSCTSVFPGFRWVGIIGPPCIWRSFIMPHSSYINIGGSPLELFPRVYVGFRDILKIKDFKIASDQPLRTIGLNLIWRLSDRKFAPVSIINPSKIS